jgi:hypothetical protein
MAANSAQFWFCNVVVTDNLQPFSLTLSVLQDTEEIYETNVQSFFLTLRVAVLVSCLAKSQLFIYLRNSE